MITINCSLCGNKFDKFLGEYSRQIKKGNKNFFCSKECIKKHLKNTTGNRGKSLRLKNETKYYLLLKKCPQCNNIISYDNRINDYCSQKCAALYTQKDGGHCHWSDEDKKKISNKLKDFYKTHSHHINHNKNHLKKRINKICKCCNKSFEVINCCKDKRFFCSWDCYKNHIKNGYLKGKSGGYRECGGKGKQGWYKGYYCHSTWELAWVIYQLEHNVSFIRNKQGFDYELNGVKHKFYPDFIINGQEYVEIKGWDNGTVSAKLSQFPYKLTVLKLNEMKPYIEYAKQKYGNELEKLYEKDVDISI